MRVAFQRRHILKAAQCHEALLHSGVDNLVLLVLRLVCFPVNIDTLSGYYDGDSGQGARDQFALRWPTVRLQW